jgi:hypothetical protein
VSNEARGARSRHPRRSSRRLQALSPGRDRGR